MPSTGYVIPVDPADLANRFAATTSDLFLYEQEREESDPEMEALFSGEDCDTLILPLLDKIPPREADLITLYYVCKKRQADIAEIFGVTQAAVSYRLDRGIQRLKFLLSIPTVTEEDLRRDLSEVFDQIDVNILVGMWQTTCQSEVATKLQLTQGRVRHRFFKAVEALKNVADKNEKYRTYEKIFSSISSKNFNILRSVSLPQWRNRGIDCCI
jgi:DNA-directed RNA polymerase specialized sigma24 family protein